ncbi:hypothetical protein [Moorena sp. SIO3H5]|uniref:hypothetical protein n=1 Tax=Moorena sp. SIO3H5 TaxID=2607834 RepID=UPI0013BB4A95|nr:hypothetical protein [Moorena sp. SIO3H5]NEO68796.1 hypothetical protein [Moorena sp. SIO3H5]
MDWVKTLRKRFGKADATRTRSVAYGLSFRQRRLARRALASDRSNQWYNTISRQTHQLQLAGNSNNKQQ